LKPPFDISGDLDTPFRVMKLACSHRASCSRASKAASGWPATLHWLRRRLEVKLDRDGLTIGHERRPYRDQRRTADALRYALKLAPTPEPNIAGTTGAPGRLLVIHVVRSLSDCPHEFRVTPRPTLHRTPLPSRF